MTKEELLNGVKALALQQQVTREELLAAFDDAAGDESEVISTRKITLSDILYYLGAAIVFVGISIFIGQNWTKLNAATKIVSTLGAGMASYLVGVLLGRYEKLERVATAFYFISALVTPLGLGVTFDNAGMDIGKASIQSLISGILTATYLASFLVFRKNLFVLFLLIFATWFFFSFTNFLVGTNSFFETEKFYESRTLLVGLSYLFLGYAFSNDERKSLTGFLYCCGVLAFLGAALALGGWTPHQSVFWEILFPGLTFGVIFLSIHLKSKSFLILGSLFLMGYILKITDEYFSQGMGWPLALVFAGLLLIATGYFTLQVNKKYLA